MSGATPDQVPEPPARTAIVWRWLARHLHLAGLARGLVYSSDGSTRLLGFGRAGGYVLWLPSWWWECQRQQGLRVRGRHRPLSPYIAWTCAACLACIECGAPYECKPECGTGGEAAFVPHGASGSSEGAQ